MDISVPVFFELYGRYLCFKHAVEESGSENGKYIRVIADDSHYSDYYLGDDSCYRCVEEDKIQEEKLKKKEIDYINKIRGVK